MPKANISVSIIDFKYYMNINIYYFYEMNRTIYIIYIEALIVFL